MSTDSKHLVILAAGTGGHVMPGLAVAKVMASRGWKISWVGTVAGMERGLVERHGIPFHALDFQGVRGRGPLGAIKGGFKLIGAFFASMKLLNELKPDAVFSTGGYVAVPFGFAAHRRKLPRFLYTNSFITFTSSNLNFLMLLFYFTTTVWTIFFTIYRYNP